MPTKSNHNSLRLSAQEIRDPFRQSDWERRFPPILTAQQAADLLQIPLATVYQNSSRGLYAKCARKVEKYLRFVRDRLIDTTFN